MLNGLSLVPRRQQTALFSGSTQIGLSGVSSSPVSSIGGNAVVQNSVLNSLRLDGWNVVRVSVVGDIIMAVVIGSTSDNLSAVKTAFKNTIARRSFINLNNVVAEFTTTGAGQTIPQLIPQPIPQSSQVPAFNTYILEFNISPNITAGIGTSTFGENVKSSIEAQLYAYDWSFSNVTWTSGSILSSLKFRVTVRVGSQYSKQDVANSIVNTLSSIGTVSGIQIADNTPFGAGGNNDISESGIGDFLKDLGTKLGFGATGALVGGGIVAALVFFLVIKD